MAERRCSFEDCARPVAQREWCRQHYDFLRRRGRIERLARPSAQERFMAKVDVGDACWLWTGAVGAEGYGRFSVARSTWVGSHRWAYEHFVGAAPVGYDIDHTCHNVDLECAGGTSCLHRRCVNPEHLEAVPRSTNLSRGRGQSQTHCPAGHRYDDANTRLIATRTGGFARQCRTCDRIRAQTKRDRAKMAEGA